MRSSVQPPPEKSWATSQQRQGCLQRVFKHPSLQTILFLYSQRSNCQRLGGIYLHIPFPTNTKGYPPTPTKPSKYFKSLLFSIITVLWLVHVTGLYCRTCRFFHQLYKRLITHSIAVVLKITFKALLIHLKQYYTIKRKLCIWYCFYNSVEVSVVVAADVNTVV